MDELKDRLAYALFRRHQIDEVEYTRYRLGLNQPGDGIGTSVYNSYRHELTEQAIKTSWSADGATRAKWHQLAAEAMRLMHNEPLTELPKRLSCTACNGYGRLAKVGGLQTCEACGGSGIPAA